MTFRGTSDSAATTTTTITAGSCQDVEKRSGDNNRPESSITTEALQMARKVTRDASHEAGTIKPKPELCFPPLHPNPLQDQQHGRFLTAAGPSSSESFLTPRPAPAPPPDMKSTWSGSDEEEMEARQGQRWRGQDFSVD